ncbi:ABC superfamily ATP binding cassette transporter [Alteracholeplasma palmae J233]|uniref:ABC superfamily ATP binding cassette transporter n=1 Tax=Alteracholeplasma palmae (strain ATCC 49389 / J233) TaxID=1318466 RepID=U4KK65_ALTPJ|nr:ATP-binding cassette domain-containing protein [Alteracholeplasma palmae]CCV63912.1 ABC superfamily ATP binding cassette transporter [Alteracholeplasma palmae J233]
MLNIKDLVIKDYQHDITLVDRLFFTLNKNDKIAIIGSEGSGKSTLLKVLYGNIPSYIEVTGDIIRPNVIFYMEQNIKNQYQAYTVNQYLYEENKYNNYTNIHKIVNQFKLNYDEIKDRKINTFSGGERVKIGLIKALLINPDVFLLDEPSNDIDFETINIIEDFLIKTEIPVIFISHDQRLLENVATGIIHLEHTNKRMIAKTTFLNIDYKTYKEHYLNNFSHQLIKARKQRSDYKNKIEKFRQIYQKVEYKQNQAVRNPGAASILKKKIHVLKSQEKRYIKEKENFLDIPEKEEAMNIFFDDNLRINAQKSILSLRLNALSLPDGINIRNINLEVMAKDKIVIFGKNGIGKTTLMNFIYKKLISEDIKVGYLTQDYLDILDENMTVVNFLINNQNKYDQSKIRQILGTLGLRKNEMTNKIKNISEGTKLKVMLLLLVSNSYEVLLLDEPTRNISPINQDEIYGIIFTI